MISRSFLFSSSLLFIVLIFSACGFFTGKRSNLIEENPRFLPYEVVRDQSCRDKRDNLDRILEEANFCETAADCQIVTGFGCPFDCYTLLNRAAKVDGIQKFVNDYRQNCVQCEYSCIAPPSTDQVACENRRCVIVPAAS